MKHKYNNNNKQYIYFKISLERPISVRLYFETKVKRIKRSNKIERLNLILKNTLFSTTTAMQTIYCSILEICINSFIDILFLFKRVGK